MVAKAQVTALNLLDHLIRNADSALSEHWLAEELHVPATLG
jgi:hypothetical protein